MFLCKCCVGTRWVYGSMIKHWSSENWSSLLKHNMSPYCSAPKQGGVQEKCQDGYWNGMWYLESSICKAIQMVMDKGEPMWEHEMEAYRRWGLTDEHVMLMFSNESLLYEVNRGGTCEEGFVELFNEGVGEEGSVLKVCYLLLFSFMKEKLKRDSSTMLNYNNLLLLWNYLNTIIFLNSCTKYLKAIKKRGYKLF